MQKRGSTMTVRSPSVRRDSQCIVIVNLPRTMRSRNEGFRAIIVDESVGGQRLAFGQRLV